MKLSGYHFLFPIEEGGSDYLAYNSLSNALAILKYDSYTEYQKFEEDNHYSLPQELFDKLRTGGFIVDDDLDELSIIELRLLRSRFGTRTLGLTLAPTSACNFRCVYCYEKDNKHNVSMNDDVQNAICELIKERATTIDKINISRYGGEPLLAINIIESMTARIREIIQGKEIAYDATIVTNGYLLVNTDVFNRSAIIDVEKKIRTLGLKQVFAYPAPIQNTNDCCQEKNCWSDIGIDELSIGNILDRSSRCNRLLEYLLYDPKKDEKCSACKLLPICMGDCPHDRLSKIKDRCIVYTDILMKHLRSIASIIQRENAKQNKRISYLKTWR